VYIYVGLAFWMKEVFKTSFDLYAYQFVTITNNTFMYDPLEEFLNEKLKLTLYTQPMPYTFRIIAWLELLFLILQWFGIIS